MDSYYMGLGAGIGAGLFLYAIIVLIKRKRGGCAKEYDERQRAAQGKAAKAAMFSHMGFAALGIIFCADGGPAWLSIPAALFFGIVVSVCVYAIYCILHDAYFEFSKSPRSTLVMLAVITVVEFLLVGRKAARGEVLVDGVLDLATVMSASCGVVMLAVLATALIKLGLDKKQEARDEES